MHGAGSVDNPENFKKTNIPHKSQKMPRLTFCSYFPLQRKEDHRNNSRIFFLRSTIKTPGRTFKYVLS